MNVTASGFARMTRSLLAMSAACCPGRLVFTLEGGYHGGALTEGVAAVLTTLARAADGEDKPPALAAPGSQTSEVIRGRARRASTSLVLPHRIREFVYSGSMRLSEAIGNTPLLRLTPAARPPSRGSAKAEWMNPGGSVKDRRALSVILDGERRGALTPQKTIIHASSGNTAMQMP